MPSQAWICSALAGVAPAVMPAFPSHTPFGIMGLRYSQREDCVNRYAPDRDLVRHPRTTSSPALEQLRTDPPDGSRPRTILATRGQQALRGTQETGCAGPRHSSEPAPGDQKAHRLHDHRRRAGPPGHVDGTTSAKPGARVRATPAHL